MKRKEHGTSGSTGRRVAWWLLLAGLVMLPAIAFADISVRASLSPARAQVGQTVALSIEIQGAQSVQAPSLDDLDGFDARYVGPSTQVSIVNGQMSASVTHRYALTPLREGVFQLGPFEVEYEGKAYRTATVQVSVSAAADRTTGGVAGGSRGENLRLRLSGREGDVYIHERVPIEVTLYVRGSQVSDIAFPTLSAAGLSVEAFPQPDRAVEELDGVRYEALHFRSFVVPLQSGARALGPATVRLNVVTQGNGFFFSQKRSLELQSNALNLNVLPLPEQGKPAGFNGAVGQFNLDVSASPNDVVAGDPVTVRMTLRGDGNLTDAQPPRFADARGFRIYDPQPGKDEAAGTRSFEQVLIPETVDIKAVPSVLFSFFDPRAGEYRTVRSEPIGLTVRPPANAAAPQIIAAPGQAKPAVPENLGRDIVYIKDDPGTLQALGAAWYGSFLWWLWLPVPAILLAAAFVHDRRRERLSGDSRYARYSAAGKVARSGLSDAEQALQGGRIEAAYDALSQTVREYLAAKLDLPRGAVDADAVAAQGVGGEELQAVREFFGQLEESRYTGRPSEAGARALFERAQRIVNLLEKRRGRSALWSFALLFVAAMATAADTPQSTFFHANSSYAEGRYDEAAREYESLIAGGLESANLHFNLGNSYFKLGQKGRAIQHYERAAQLAPRDPDVEANLEFARSLTGAPGCEPRWWARLVFPLAPRFTSAGLFAAVVILYTLTLAFLIASRTIRTRPAWARYGATVCGAAALTVLGSLAARLDREEWRVPAVVIADGDVAARFEPAGSGTVHFTLKQGSRVTISDRREGWLQAQRCDGRRGWVPAEALASVMP